MNWVVSTLTDMSTSFFANNIMRNCDTYFPAEKFQQGHGSSSIQISYFYWWRQHLRLLLFPLFEKILDAKSRLPKSTSGLKQKCAQAPKLFLGTVKYSFTWFLHLTLQTKELPHVKEYEKLCPKMVSSCVQFWMRSIVLLERCEV